MTNKELEKRIENIIDLKNALEQESDELHRDEFVEKEIENYLNSLDKEK